MTNAVINIDTTPISIKKNTDYTFNYQITAPYSDSKVFPINFTDEGALGTGKVYSVPITKSDYKEITDMQVDDSATPPILNVAGIKKVGYKVKIELLGLSDTVVSILKDYDSSFLYDDISGSLVISADLLTTALNPYHIKVTILYDDNTTSSNQVEIDLYDTQPYVSIDSMSGSLVRFTLGDEENDTIQYQIKLNGNKVYPTDKDFTDLITTGSFSYYINKTLILRNVNNALEITVKDEWGKQSSITYNFIGTYMGLMFSDGADYYSTDTGQTIKKLDFGDIFVGKESIIKQVYLKNTTGYSVKDIIISVDEGTIPNLSDVLLSKTDSPFNGSHSITFSDVLETGNQISFYVKVITNLDEEDAGTFKINVTSTSTI